MKLTRRDEDQLLKLHAQEENYWKYDKLKIYYGDRDYTSPTNDVVKSRFSYPKHVSFFDAGSEYVLRAFIAGNQTGKSLAGCYEDVIHATGDYPSWWKGHRFDRPVHIWLCGDRAEAIRDGLQKKLIGDGTAKEEANGLIPRDRIFKLSLHNGVANCIGQYFIRHKSGGISTITMKTYQSGRTAFESAVIDVIHLDEECPRDIFSECLTRTTQSNGILYLTFTPDSGLTETVSFFLDKNQTAKKFVVTVGWDDVPHITEERKKLLLASYSPHERDCRSKGIPYLGRGKIYPISEDDIFIDPIKLPRHWPRVFGMDVGYAHPTACIWAAWDRESDIVYCYSEYKVAQREPSAHANAILARGRWIPGIIDSASKSTNATDCNRLSDLYEKFGLRLDFVKKGAGSVEEGILEVLDRLESGRLKFFKTLVETRDEMRIYRRDDNGKIVDEKDDIMDALRYMITQGLWLAEVEPLYDNDNKPSSQFQVKSSVGGY